MKHIEFKDEISINQQVNINIWEPENDIACVIFFVHGFGEHSARYSFWAENFCKRNIAFAAIDLIGFGKSSGKRGAIKSYDDYLFCVRRLISITKNRFPEKPIILYGHSLGGNIACSYALKNQGEIDGLILSSPWFKLAIRISWINILFQSIWKNIFQIFFRRFYIVNYYLSHNTESNIDFNTSPLNHRKIKVKMLFKVIFAAIRALKCSLFKFLVICSMENPTELLL